MFTTWEPPSGHRDHNLLPKPLLKDRQLNRVIQAWEILRQCSVLWPLHCFSNDGLAMLFAHISSVAFVCAPVFATQSQLESRSLVRSLSRWNLIRQDTRGCFFLLFFWWICTGECWRLWLFVCYTQSQWSSCRCTSLQHEAHFHFKEARLICTHL